MQRNARIRVQGLSDPAQGRFGKNKGDAKELLDQ